MLFIMNPTRLAPDILSSEQDMEHGFLEAFSDETFETVEVRLDVNNQEVLKRMDQDGMK